MKIDKFDLYRKAIEIRKMLGESDTSPIDVFAVVQNIPHLSLVMYPMGNNISGMCVKIENETVIAINSDMSIGRQNFSIAHELYHYYFDSNMKSIVCKKEIGVGDYNEKCADIFASYFLMPSITKEIISKRKMSVERVVELEQLYKTSHQSMLYRLIEESIITKEQANNCKNNAMVVANWLGYDTSLYTKSNKKNRRITYGYYLKQAQKLSELDLISSGKYEQLLLEAFRSDLVYGDDTCVGVLND